MSMVQLDVKNPAALTEALRNDRAGDILVYTPSGGEQMSLIRCLGKVAYYCDLNQRPPTASVIDAAKTAGVSVENINAMQRNADLAEGAIPTMGPLTREEGLQKLSRCVVSGTQSVPAPRGALFRVLSTLFGKKIQNPMADVTPGKAESNHQRKTN